MKLEQRIHLSCSSFFETVVQFEAFSFFSVTIYYIYWGKKFWKVFDITSLNLIEQQGKFFCIIIHFILPKFNLIGIKAGQTGISNERLVIKNQLLKQRSLPRVADI